MEASFASLFIGAVLLFVWALISKRSEHGVDYSGEPPLKSKRPPSLPSRVPVVGHLLQFLWDANKLMLSAAHYLDTATPTKVSLFGFSSYVVSGPEAIVAFFRENHYLSTTSRSISVMENAFGCPHRFLDQFRPRYGPDGRPDEVEQLIHHNVQTGLSGPHLEALTARLQDTLWACLLKEAEVGHGADWIDVPDLHSFIRKHLFTAVIHALFGPYMVSLNPNIADDFWKFNESIRTLFMGLPAWMTPKAHKMRTKMLQSIERWQEHAKEHCDIDEVGNVEWEPYYGSRFIRDRQILLTRRGIVDGSARAAENFAFMWAANSNSAPAASWFLFEVLQDPQLKKEIKSELSDVRLVATLAAIKEGEHLAVPIDTARLLSNPLLQSAYAETLRLRVAALVVREAAKDDFSFSGWQIKKDEALAVSTRTEAMNKDIWSTGGSHEPHPLQTFWSRRFLVDPADSDSGPLRTPKRHKINAAANMQEGPYFSIDGLSGSWIPYGGGRSLCPGRHLAKRKMLVATAAFLSVYDIELTGNKKPAVDMNHFGFGTLPPKHKVRCRVRRQIYE